MSDSDWVAKITRGILLAQRLQPFAQLPGKAFVVERKPAFVDDQQRRPAVEPALDAMEEIGQHRGRGRGSDQPLGLKGLDFGLSEPLGLGIEQAAVGTAEAIGLQRALQRLRLQQAPTGRSACARRLAPTQAKTVPTRGDPLLPA